MLESVLLLFLQATRILPIVGGAALGFMLAPLFKRKRLPTALYVALSITIFNGLYFVSAGGSPWRWALLLPLAALALAPFVLAPLGVLRKAVAEPGPREPYDPERHPLPSLGLHFVGMATDLLRKQGFAVVDGVVVAMGRSRARYVILDHAAEAIRVQLRTEPAGSTLSGSPGHTSIFSVLPDGRWAVGSNEQPRLASAEPDPATVLLRLVDALHPMILLDIYRKWVVTLPGAERRALPPGMNAAEFSEVTRRRYYERMLALGWVRETPRGYRHTVKGAFLSTWSLTFPLRQIRLFAAFRDQQRILGELGLRMDERPPRPTNGQIWRSYGTLNVAQAAALIAFGFVWPALADRGGFSGIVSPTLAAAVHTDSVVPAPLPAGFAVPADFPGAVRALERLAGAGSRPLTVDDGFSGAPGKDLVMVPVDSGRVEGLLASAQPVFGARGFVLFHAQEMDGMHGEPHALALYPSRDPFAVVVAMNTNGANYGISPRQIADWLRETDREHPLLINSVGFDFVQARFRTPLAPADANALAARVARFCPDVVTQGTGSVSALAREMRKTRTLYCWWD